jgi:hypothetical protein
MIAQEAFAVLMFSLGSNIHFINIVVTGFEPKTCIPLMYPLSPC